jgi:tetratricopeptide (TPR) repeat protein
MKRLALIRALRAETVADPTMEAGYAQTFADLGIVEAMPVEEAAALIRDRTEKVAVELAVALDEWALKRKKQRDKDWRRLLAIARAADRDPWRDRLRAQILSTDDTALHKLAEQAQVARLPVRSVELLGRVLLDRHAYDRALALLEEAQQRQPDDVWINYLLAVAALNVLPAQSDKAIRYATAVAVLRPEARHLLVMALLQKQEWAEATAIAHDLIGRGPNNPHHHALLARVYHERGDRGRAISAAQKATRLDAGNPFIHNTLGTVLSAAKRYDEALLAFDRAVQLDRDFAGAHNNRGNALDGLNRLDEAIAAWEEALRLDPLETRFRHNLAKALFRKGRLDEALVNYREILKSKPDDHRAYHNLGAILQRQQNYKEAVAALRKALALGAREGTVYYNLGAALHGTGALEEAHSAFEEAVRLQPDHVEALEALAQSFTRKGDLDRAAALYRQALRYNDKLFRGHFVLANQFERQGKFAEALASFQRGAELVRDNPAWSKLIAKDLAKLQRWARLDARLAEVLAGKGQPDSADERIVLAQFCYVPKRFYRTSARFYTEALKDPALAANPRKGHVYGAGCASAQAGCGQGGDAPREEGDRARLRAQARTWLRADLANWKKELAKGPRERALVKSA